MLTMLAALGIMADFGIVIWKLYGCAKAFPYGWTRFKAKLKGAMIDLGFMAIVGVFVAMLFTPTMVGIITPFVGLFSTFLITRLEKVNHNAPKMSMVQWFRS